MKEVKLMFRGKQLETERLTFFLGLLLFVLSANNLLQGQPIVQEFDTQGDLAAGMFSLVVDPFDTMNGTRSLTEVELEFSGFVDMDILITNYTSLDLVDNDWFFDAGANMVLAFDQKPGFENGGPFYGLGGVFENGITGVLSAGSGGDPPPFGNPTPGDVTISESLSNDFLATVPSTSFLSYFETDEPLNASISPFLDFALSPPQDEPNGFIDIETTSLEFNGTLSITYNWVQSTGRPEDCNGDGTVDMQDLNCVCGEPAAQLEDVLNAVNLIQGDTDGDGDVGFSDFLNLSGNFGNAGNYLDGDLDCDGMVAFGDFLILSGNFGQTTNEAVASVPEPSGSIMWLAVCVGALLIRRRS